MTDAAGIAHIDIADSRPILDWFTRRTYHADDFDVAALAARKAALGVTVSVVLPAHNEEATVAGGVRAARQMHGTLVDQIVVIDDRSSDATARCAAAAGAEVHASSTLVPSFGPSLGKGDVLWRSLTVASGDIVVFVDADIRNPHPRFIWALIAPLLADPRIQLVKAFYDRPLAAGGVMHSAGGGRVTELLARPLLNLFWPALAQVVQPLSGEYAARRGLLEALPFFTGYGVEIGMLIDTLRLVGHDAIAQVDVGQRIHRNQELDALSRMSFALTQVVMRRTGRFQQRSIRTGSDGYMQFARDSERRVKPRTHTVTITERPPLATLSSPGDQGT